MNNEICRGYKLAEGGEKIVVNQGEKIPRLREGIYLVRCGEEIIISPSKLGYMKMSLKGCMSWIEGNLRKLFDPEKGVLETLAIEGPLKVVEVNYGDEEI